MFNIGMSVNILRDCLVAAAPLDLRQRIVATAYRGSALLFTDIRSMLGERLEVLHVL
jgi:hypothetical protein